MTCIMIFKARQRVTGYNMYFKASQRVLAKVFSITCLFACCEEVCYELAVIPVQYYIKLLMVLGFCVSGLRPSAFRSSVFSLKTIAN